MIALRRILAYGTAFALTGGCGLMLCMERLYPGTLGAAATTVGIGAPSAGEIVSRRSAADVREGVGRALATDPEQPLRSMLSWRQRELYDGLLADIRDGRDYSEMVIGIGDGQATENAISEVFCAVIGDHPELEVNDAWGSRYFWKAISGVMPAYQPDGGALRDAIDGYDPGRATPGRKGAASACPAAGGDHAEARNALMRLVTGCEYDLDADRSGTAYGALVDGRAKCLGYARAYQRVLRSYGIPCAAVIGYVRRPDGTETKHAWCVALLDGEAEWIDPTFADAGDMMATTYWCMDDEHVAGYTPIWGSGRG